MGLFKKQIDRQAATDFFVMAYTKILSSQEQLKNVDQLRKITEAAPILRYAKQQDFDEQLRAVNAAWLDIAWSKYIFGRIDIMTSVDFMTELKSRLNSQLPGFSDCASFADFYGESFGSSSTDGNTAMAWVFIRNILRDFDQAIAKRYSDEFNNAVRVFSYLFVGIYDNCRAGIKSHHIIH